jgi:hypothetical protein
VRGKNQQLCCGGQDCAETLYRVVNGQYELLTREKMWLSVPKDMITFMAVPGDQSTIEPDHYAHLCAHLLDADELRMYAAHQWSAGVLLGDRYIFYCAFIPPGGY